MFFVLTMKEIQILQKKTFFVIISWFCNLLSFLGSKYIFLKERKSPRLISHMDASKEYPVTKNLSKMIFSSFFCHSVYYFLFISFSHFSSMPFLCCGTLLFLGNLPRVLQLLILKYASCLIPFIETFLFLSAEWSILVFKEITHEHNIIF